MQLLLAIGFSRWILHFFRRLGLFGLLLLSTLDSSFFVLPFGNDLLLIALVSANRNSLIWIVYVLVSAVGSVLGVLTVDLLMRKAGEKGLERFISAQRIEKLKTKLENKAGITVFIATLIPPPFPFTGAVMTASALQTPRSKLLTAVFCGRLLRFSVEAILALYFGRHVIKFINSEVVTYVVYGIIAIGVVLSTLSLVKWLKRRSVQPEM